MEREVEVALHLLHACLDLILLWHNLFAARIWLQDATKRYSAVASTRRLDENDDVCSSSCCCCSKTYFIARLSLILCECGNCATLAVIGNSLQFMPLTSRQADRHIDRQTDSEQQQWNAKVNLSLCWLRIRRVGRVGRQQLKRSLQLQFSIRSQSLLHAHFNWTARKLTMQTQHPQQTDATVTPRRKLQFNSQRTATTVAAAVAAVAH